MDWRLLPAWEPGTGLLASLRTLYSYTDREPDRATGWLYSATQAGQLPPTPWPPVLAEAGPGLLAKLEADLGIAFTAVCFQAYLNGAGCAWHHDAEWGAQAILSLGMTRSFVLRRNETGTVVEMRLAHGDLLYMPPGFQDGWEHAVPAERVTGERCSLVFRARPGE